MQTNCIHRYFQKGFKQPRDLGMPERVWGEYLPGDEPGYMCDITGDGCDEDVRECPLWAKTNLICEFCEVPLWKNGDILACPHCGEIEN